MTESTNPPQASATTSEADAEESSGHAPEEPTLGGITDDQLPDDLQPGDDNPLAEPLDPDDENTKSREELDLLGDQDDSSDSGDDGADGSDGS